MSIDWNRRGPAAQKTVEVLKKRVRSLYDEGAQTAIHRQLERAREREEKLRRRRELMAVRTAELERYSAELEGKVAERTAELRAILDNVTFGFLLVDADARIQPGSTASCTELLGRQLEVGDDLPEVLGILDTAAEPMMRLGIEQVFDDFLPEDVASEQIPQQFLVRGKHIRAECRTVRNEDGGVRAILVTLSDVSALWEAERRARENAALVGILRQKSAFASFVADAKGRLAAAHDHVGDQPWVRRAVHTVKGNAASYGLEDVARTAHRVEGDERIDARGLDAIERALDRFLEAHVEVLGRELLGGHSKVEVDTCELRRLRAMLDPIDEHALEEWGNSILQRPIGELIGPMEVFVDRIAERLERDVEFEVEGAEIPVDPEVMQPLVGTLTHLLRNAIDHGIEPADERGVKPVRGKLNTRFLAEEDRWVVEVTDDGRGIDLDAVTEKAVASGELTAEEAARLDDRSRARLIFLDGLSSRDEATDMSGRGVGMSAVLEVVGDLGGEIDVRTAPGEGTTVRIEVPRAPARA